MFYFKFSKIISNNQDTCFTIKNFLLLLSKYKKNMQGKRKDQIEFSTRAVMISIIGISVVIISMLIIDTSPNTPDQPGPPHNYWMPVDTLECNDEYRMWIGGNGDTIWE
jgi:crotonobetainyl-CoA:carnitine CoA-transferase CaiB-like acyl-CoA transferase